MPADPRALAEEAIEMAGKVSWVRLRVNVELGNWTRHDKRSILRSVELVNGLARALIEALDERDALLADLPHALGKCGCVPLVQNRINIFGNDLWPEAHTVAIARVEAKVPRPEVSSSGREGREADHG